MQVNCVSTVILVILLLCSVNSIVVRGTSGQVSNAIIIGPDGRVDSSSGIQRNGDKYVLTKDINLPIEIQKNNIILDGANHILQGSGKDNDLAAITLKASNVIVTNFYITSWTAGIYGAYNNNTITVNEITDTNRAIALYATDYIISKNTIQGNDQGVYIKDVLPAIGNNLIINNQIVNNDAYAFNIISSTRTTITQNNVIDNNCILNIIGGSNGNMADCGYNLLYSNNFVNNKGALYVSLSYLYVMSGLTPISPVGNWDNGTIGNYWSDYNTRYPNASKIGDLEAVGDTAYLIESKTTYMFDYGEETVIFGRSFDHYPLIHSINIQTDTDSKSPNSDDQHYLETVTRYV